MHIKKLLVTSSIFVIMRKLPPNILMIQHPSWKSNVLEENSILRSADKVILIKQALHVTRYKSL